VHAATAPLVVVTWAPVLCWKLPRRLIMMSPLCENRAVLSVTGTVHWLPTDPLRAESKPGVKVVGTPGAG
jgi:hypothetical protein